MPIRFQIRDGKLEGAEIDTVEEAVAFYKRLNGRQEAPSSIASTPAPASVPTPRRRRIVMDHGHRMNPAVRALLREMVKHPEGAPGAVLAKAIGTDTHGLGSVVAALNRWGNGIGFSNKQIIIKKRVRHNGQLMRSLRLGDSLQRRIREGLLDD